jgi:hypothetical protein
MQSAGQVYQSNSSYIQTQLEKQREVHAKNMESYKAARDEYLKRTALSSSRLMVSLVFQRRPLMRFLSH